MRRLPGQAGRLLLRLVQLALALVVASTCAAGLLAWRLSEGPLELAWLARRIEASVARDTGGHLAIGSAAIAWDGFRHGLGRPLILRVAGIAATDAAGARVASVASAELRLSTGGLLHGAVVPVALAIDGAGLHLIRDADGATRLDLGGASLSLQGAASPSQTSSTADLLRELTAPAGADGAGGARWAQLREVRIHEAEIRVSDGQLGADWRVAGISVDLLRAASGGIRGEGDATLGIGRQAVPLHLAATLDASGTTAIRVMLAQVIPAAFAGEAAALAPLSALDLPVTVAAEADLDDALAPRTVRVHARLGGGTVHVGRGVALLAEATLEVEGSPSLASAVVKLAAVPRPDGPRTVVQLRAEARRHDGGYAVAGAVDLDQANFTDLPGLWPEGTGGPGTRPWITKNITAGVASNLHVEVALQAPADLSDLNLDSVSGGLDGRDLTLHWLRPVPPIEHINGHLAFTAPDVIDIAMTSGRQTGGSASGLALRSGHVHLTGIAGHDQFADIEGDIAGPLTDLLTLLKNPKIKLLDRRPVPMQDPAGQVAGKLTVAHLPLKDAVSLDDIQIHTAAKLTQIHLGGIAAGRDVSRGNFDLDAGNDGLHLKGTADIAAIPSQLAVDMDFRSGPPSQVIQKVVVSGVATPRMLTEAGLPVEHVFTGSVGLQGSVETRRGGRGDIVVRLDMQRAGMATRELNVSKPEGEAASGEAHVVLDHDRLAAIDHVRVQGQGIDIRGDAEVASGHPEVLRLERVVFGRTNVHGEVRLPAKPSDAYAVTLAGPSLDVSGLFAPSKKPAASEAGSGAARPAWSVDARLDRVILAGGHQATGVVARAAHDGTLLRRAEISGRIGPSAPFHLSIEPVRGGRRLDASAADTGALLRALDVVEEVQGGRLSATGSYDDTGAAHPLSGTVELDEFRVRGVAALGKILQAMTLYGIVDVLTGPGLNFTRLVAPFRYEGEVLHLADARAFSSSLGMTAKGRVDIGRHMLDLEGTIVPAYFLNAALGRVPLIGRVFSPERGGGVFSATYGVHGPTDDPSVGVNPLAALTPGFLRGIFGIFDARR